MTDGDGALDHLTDYEQRALTAYFLHAKCGYTFDKHGIVWALTRQEERLLWTGFAVWKEEMEATHDESERKPGRTATAADKREFSEFASDVNSQSPPA